MIFDVEIDFESQILALFDTSQLHQLSKYVGIYHAPVKLTEAFLVSGASLGPASPLPAPTLNGYNAYQQKYTEYQQSPHFEN